MKSRGRLIQKIRRSTIAGPAMSARGPNPCQLALVCPALDRYYIDPHNLRDVPRSEHTALNVDRGYRSQV
jgi:hypothetical protein